MELVLKSTCWRWCPWMDFWDLLKCVGRREIYPTNQRVQERMAIFRCHHSIKQVLTVCFLGQDLASSLPTMALLMCSSTWSSAWDLSPSPAISSPTISSRLSTDQGRWWPKTCRVAPVGQLERVATEPSEIAVTCRTLVAHMGRTGWGEWAACLRWATWVGWGWTHRWVRWAKVRWARARWAKWGRWAAGVVAVKAVKAVKVARWARWEAVAVVGVGAVVAVVAMAVAWMAAAGVAACPPTWVAVEVVKAVAAGACPSPWWDSHSSKTASEDVAPMACLKEWWDSHSNKMASEDVVLAVCLNLWWGNHSSKTASEDVLLAECLNLWWGSRSSKTASEDAVLVGCLNQWWDSHYKHHQTAVLRVVKQGLMVGVLVEWCNQPPLDKHLHQMEGLQDPGCPNDCSLRPVLATKSAMSAATPWVKSIQCNEKCRETCEEKLDTKMSNVAMLEEKMRARPDAVGC